MIKYTPLPWVAGRDGQSIVSTALTREQGIAAYGQLGDEAGDESWDHYGGLLVCESIRQGDQQRIIAMAEACAGVATEHLRPGLLAELMRDVGVDND